MGSRSEGVLKSEPTVPNGSVVGLVRIRRFGVFELDLHAGELRRNGSKVKLQEQPFQILAQLLEKPGEIITRDHLRNRLWPADTFVDFDHSLNAAIRRLRDALGDSAENPTFVETVARRGYRFLAPVSGIPGNPGPALVEPVAEPHSARRSHLWIAAMAAALVLVLVGVKLGLSLAKHTSAAQVQPRITRLTANPADDRVRAAAISPDGKYLAFADETGFYLRQIDIGETHPLTVPEGMVSGSLSWFPDSSHLIAGLNGPNHGSSLWEFSALGGNTRKISDQGTGPAVSPDGRQIAFITGARMHNEIWLMAADGEQPRKLAGEEGDFFGALTWSPDATRIAYVRGRLTETYGVAGSIELLNIQDRRMSSTIQFASMGWFAAVDGPLAWAPDGNLIYAQAESPPRQLDSNLWSVQLDASGHTVGMPARLTSDAGVVTSVSMSGDGKRLVYIKGIPQPDVYVAKIEGPATISEPVRLTLDDRQDLPFDWMPDSKSVLFISDRTGTFNIYRQGIDQTLPEVLVGGDHPTLTARLSPDGTQLLYLVYPSWTSKPMPISLMRMPLAGGGPQQVLQEEGITNQQCARAPATVCLYGVVTNNEFRLISFDPMKGTGAQVYSIKDDLAQLYNWSLSPDGTTVAIAKGKEGGAEPHIRLVFLNGAPDKVLTIAGRTGVGALDWAFDGKSLWASSAEDERSALLNINLQGHTRVLWRPEKKKVYWAIPSRDGRYLALHVASSSANAWMLERP